MRQVPTKSSSTNCTSALIGIVGRGRLGTHLAYYLSQKNIPHKIWARSDSKNLETALQGCTTIALAIRDDVLESFIAKNPFLHSRTLVHFSGAMVLERAWGAHPLYTFGPELYSAEVYQKIPFILEKDSPALAEFFPGLENPEYRIPASHKALYHSLCVLAGNFTALLWQKFFNELQNNLKLPPEACEPYARQIFENILKNPNQALTGPLARGDWKTIQKNLVALGEDPFADVYRAFVNTQPSKKERGRNEHLSV